MLQGIGSMLILAAGIGIGIFRARELHARPRQIYTLIQALSALEAQIVYAEVPLSNGFRRCEAGCGDDEIGRLFFLLLQRLSEDRRCSAGEALAEVRRQTERDLALGQAEWSVLTFLCDNLGRADRREAEKQIQLSLRQLKTIAQSAAEEADKKGKAAVYLGVCGALMAVVVCI